METFEEKLDYLASWGSITENMKNNAMTIQSIVETDELYKKDPDINRIVDEIDNDYKEVMEFNLENNVV